MQTNRKSFPAHQRNGALNQHRSPKPLRQGSEEQRLASAPSRGAAQVAASSLQEPCGSGSQSFGEAESALARRSSCLHGPSMALDVPRSVFRLLKFGLVGSPASLQSAGSIVEGPEGCKHPAPISRWDLWLSAPASCNWLASLVLPPRPQEKSAGGLTAGRTSSGDCRWRNGRNVLQHLALRRRCRVPSGRIRRRSSVVGTPIPRWAPFTGGKMPCITPSP
jgi:hypothetical protein